VQVALGPERPLQRTVRQAAFMADRSVRFEARLGDEIFAERALGSVRWLSRRGSP
jgi:hypothetical protein